MNKGRVYLVGAGPGDENLITKKGFDLLTKCDVVIYDRLINTKLLEKVKKDCTLIYVGKIVGNHEVTQNEINKIIVENAKNNKIIVRLKGGDPFVFGRGGEEILELIDHDIPYEVVPGVSSSVAGLAYAGIPITHRGFSRGFHVVTGFSAGEKESAPNNLDVLAKIDDTLVFLMGISNLEKIISGLLVNGKCKNTPVAVISNATTSKQKEVRGTLRTIVSDVSKANIEAPALIVVGKVASLDFREKSSKLSGVNIGITGTFDFLNKQRALFEEQGANVVDIFSYKVIENEWDIDDINKYSYIVFTSANSVRLTFKKIFEKGLDLRQLSKVKFAVVGMGTSEVLKSYGFNHDFMPESFSSKCLGEELVKMLNSDDRVFIPRANTHTDDMTKIFDQNNIQYDEKVVYDIVGESNDFSNIENLDYITFSSSKSVQEFFEKFTDLTKLKNIKIICIGDLTKEALLKANVDAIKTEVCTVEGLLKQICKLRGTE